ncbi:peptidoglycan recognition protein family protein [Streptomyces sp. CS057]|uniref:peptidoglycan recognition protein family protein n=1 Tax=Streptomyces sp. CS057 TaxID=1982764 RepID=UPI000B40853E|nr:peptidoglycan recognition protein [Streptomyces sp. CS057]OWA21787.1 N-acetylmuramoyl-L-alanine amidase [Streptomyces sp. CS057]
MRALLVTSVGITCAAALTLPLAAPALSAPAAHSASARPPSQSPESPGSGPPPARTEAAPDEANEADRKGEAGEGGALEVPEAAPPRTGEPRAAELAGSTQSLPLEPLAAPSDRSMGPAASGQGLDRRTARPFSLVGVVWDDAEAELHGTVQVRTRATGGTSWSDWQDVETHNAEHAADPGSAEWASGSVRGATAPLWVGDSDGVEVRVRPEAADPQHPDAAVPLPAGLRLELVDPGADPAPEPGLGASPGRTVTPAAFAGNPVPPTVTTAVPEVLTAESAATSAVNADLAPLGAAVIPALTKAETEEEAAIVAAGAKPYIGPRPKIITRKGWGADEKLRERNFAYTKSVKAAFVHHSATGNNYTCKQAPSVLRSIYRYHVKSSGWRDFGYNFAVDKCGNIYEGRAGGVAKAVLGAHTLGFNTNTMGVAVLGTYSSTNPPAAAVTAVSKLTAWKLGLFGANPKGKVTLVSGGSGKYAKGKKVKMNVISGHRNAFATECPGARLYKKLGKARTSSAKLQGR